MPGTFNRYFILLPWIFHWDFHMDAWALSIDISLYCLGYFIGIFIWMPGAFNRYFIILPCIFHWDFHIDAWVLSIAISLYCLGYFIGVLMCFIMKFIQDEIKTNSYSKSNISTKFISPASDLYHLYPTPALHHPQSPIVNHLLMLQVWTSYTYQPMLG